MAFIQEGFPVSRRRFVVAIHEVDRCFGGQEEGGWWFDVGWPAKGSALSRHTRIFRSLAKARRYAERLGTEAAKASTGARSLSSVIYDGGQYRPVIQNGEQPRPWPGRKPRWE